MKTTLQTLSLALALLLGGGAALAAFILPNQVFRVSELETVREKAVSFDLPVAFVLSDEETDCGLCTGASLDAFRLLDRRTLLVYVERADWSRLPAVVRQAFKSAEAGEYLPKTVIVSPDLGQVLAVVPYIRNVNQRRETLRGVSEAVAY